MATSWAETALARLGLDRSTVIRSTGSGAALQPLAPPASGSAAVAPNYLLGEQQIEVAARLRQHDAMILAMAIQGAAPTEIAAALDVSTETVMKRLRAEGLTRRSGRPPSANKTRSA